MLCQLSYRGIHWETAQPGYAAAGAENGPKKSVSTSGNRTLGVCVTGRNVTNYTNADCFAAMLLGHLLALAVSRGVVDIAP